MTTPSFEFDVAISFGQKDEALATALHDMLKGRLSVFIYSKQQEILAGTDGEQRFNEVFGSRSKLVVVLFRESWGKTPFTRIEETAIRNRAYDQGYDFTIFIPMDEAEKQKVPQWLPRNRLYVGLQRWGIEGAAAAIEYRFSELGGEIHEETIDEVAERAARILDYKRRCENHLVSDAGVAAQRRAYEAVKIGLLDAAERFRVTLSGIKFAEKHADGPSGAVLFLSNRASMAVNWKLRYVNTLTDADLEATLWHGHPPWPGVMRIEDPKKLGMLRYNPYLLTDGEAGWKKASSQGSPINSRLATDEILKFFLNRVQDV